MQGHRVIGSKYKKTGPFLRHPVLSRHVPETSWYSPLNLRRLLKKHGVVYLKPDTGSLGRGIILIAAVGEGDCELRRGASTSILPVQELDSVLGQVIKSRRKYIIQAGVDLATYNGCPFDMRLVFQRPHQTWQLTLSSAKVALREDAILTNVARGARDYPLLDILPVYDQASEPMVVFRDLIDLAHQGASLLGTAFPLRIIGFDMAVDKGGKVWFLEANTRPQCAQCKLVNDEVSVEKYEEARKAIGP